MNRTGKTVPGALLAVSLCIGHAAEPVQETRSTVREWIALEETRASEQRAWKEERALIHDRQEALAREAERLEAALAAYRSALDGDDEERTALQADAQRLEAARDVLTDRLPDLKRRLLAWRPLFPAELDRKLAPSYVTLSSNAGKPAEQFQAGLTILSALHDFNRTLSTGRLPHPLPDNGPAEVSVLYAGFGQAWYVGPDDAGFGYPTEDGWRWQRRSDLRGAIAKALERHGAGTAEREAIDLPVELHEGADYE
jgi:hypothetical protein